MSLCYQTGGRYHLLATFLSKLRYVNIGGGIIHHPLHSSINTFKTIMFRSLKYIKITHRLSDAFQIHCRTLVQNIDYKHKETFLFRYNDLGVIISIISSPEVIIKKC